MSVIDELITDRTQADVDTLTELLGKPFAQWTAEEAAWFREASSKGAYNYTDLNRVTEAMQYLDDVFLAYGYTTGYVSILVHPGETERLYTWCESDIPTAAHMERYIANVAALRGTVAVLPTTPATPESMKLLDYIKANNIEKILVDINQLLINMAAAWFYSGEVYSGEVDA